MWPSLACKCMEGETGESVSCPKQNRNGSVAVLCSEYLWSVLEQVTSKLRWI